MGVVYRAEDPDIHRTVAVKVLHTNNGLTPQQVEVARERFRRESQSAASIDHPNIIRVLDVGEDDESREMFLVMEFVSGPTLETILREGPLDLGRAGALVGQIASGLDAAHARGIIHRDVKPSNILVTDDGTVKLADFGITHVATSALTLDMRELGTPAYMSPEQVNGKVLDSRADLFSLGVLTYEILTGRKPFNGNDVVSIVHAIAHGNPIPVSVANPELPQALDRVMERILAKEPSDRFGSGREFHEALLPCLSNHAARHSSTPVPHLRARRRGVLALAGVALLAAFVILLSRGSRTDPPGAESSSAAVAAVQPATAAPTKRPPPRQPAKGASERSSPASTSPSTSLAPGAAGPESRPSVTKAASVAPPSSTANVTIRFTHRLSRGRLVVTLDGVPIFDERFSKVSLAIVQTTVWDPLRAPVGGHTLRARVKGEVGKAYVSDSYAVEFSPGRDFELRIALKGDALTVKQRDS
jgi:serine/threonine-protein kinase